MPFPDIFEEQSVNRTEKLLLSAKKNCPNKALSKAVKESLMSRQQAYLRQESVNNAQPKFSWFQTAGLLATTFLATICMQLQHSLL